MTQTAIPYLLMRGGTSRGPYFHAEDLPSDRDLLSKVLIDAIGSGHALNIDGIGGGNAVTTKVAILSKSEQPDSDVDYFFAQVSVLDRTVDYKPTCGNIMTAVGPAAIEMGLVAATGDETTVRIRAVNTGARVDAVVQTRDGMVVYDGDTAIDGVPGTAAPVILKFMDVTGSATGKFLPTGDLINTVDGIDVTCMDVAMPMVIARAGDLGLTGYESAVELDENTDFFAQMEAIRIKAGALMGMGDVSEAVTPKFGILAQPREGGTIATRYFMPWKTHPTMAVTGAQCLASCAITEGTVADGLAVRPDGSPATVAIEHPSGKIDVLMDWSIDDGVQIDSAGLTRTARKLAAGEVYIPAGTWDGTR